ncbi:MAG: hypothetical protein E7197_01945 [Anaerovibrio sp.]|uniref:dynamin family protein n=1 Tax=Anaerovibrio sp. TaxID=1872532 RepID=UPI0025C2D87B|nr:dynamin family protein [Anaerovibrio sp.]MBE6098796.1 hypothetical protein [Anaerovibrio sp.]
MINLLDNISARFRNFRKKDENLIDYKASFKELDDLSVKLKQLRKVVQNNEKYDFSLRKLDEIIRITTEPLTMMVMGEFSSGKSTFINSLVGKKIAEVNARPTTAVITKLCYGDKEKIVVHYKDGSEEEKAETDFGKLTAITTGEDKTQENIEFVERHMPISTLKQISIIDSPGLNSIYEKHGIITQKFLDKADLVLWMFSADKPVSQSESKAMGKLSSRLCPIAVINKMDKINDDEDDEGEFLDGIRKKLKDKVSQVVGISAKLAFEGKQENDDLKIGASNIKAFYDLLNTEILPNVANYKKNTILDSMAEYIWSISKIVEKERKYIDFLAGEDRSEYKKCERDFQLLIDALIKVLIPLYEYCINGKQNVSYKLFLGILYYYGYIQGKNKADGIRLIEEAAPEAAVFAYVVLLDIYYAQGNNEKCQHCFEKLLDSTKANILCLVGFVYEKGLFGILRNEIKAFEAYEHSAHQDYEEAIFHLGRCYYSGIGINKDISKGFDLLQIAADAGVTDAIRDLGKIYINGAYYQQGIELLEKAARKGDGEAQIVLANIYLDESRLQNIDIKKMLFCSGLYRKYLIKKNIRKKSLKKAFYWASYSATAGNMGGQYILGLIYLSGAICDRNDIKAFAWFKAAAEQDHSEAQYIVGLMYNNGIGVDENTVYAENCFLNAANNNHIEAMFLTGCNQIEDNYERARQLFEKASYAGNPNAACMLALINSDEKKYDETLTSLINAANMGSILAMENISDMYKDGTGVEKDYDECLKWYILHIKHSEVYSIADIVGRELVVIILKIWAKIYKPLLYIILLLILGLILEVIDWITRIF